MKPIKYITAIIILLLISINLFAHAIGELLPSDSLVPVSLGLVFTKVSIAIVFSFLAKKLIDSARKNNAKE